MPSEYNTNNKAYAVVNNGTSSEGTPITVEDSLGTLSTNASTWDVTKASNIATALAPVVGTGTLQQVKRVATFSIY